ncbi:MAG: YabP/YqfC family sporulation protein [Lachnospiraceae bacterium]
MIKDIVLGLPVITILGNCQVHIENYRNILEISDCKIRIMTKKGPITVIGQKLQVEYYNEDDLVINGYILNVEL